MKKNDTIMELATQIIENEANAIIGLKDRIDENFQNKLIPCKMILRDSI